MNDEQKPWAHIAHRDGVWCGVISATHSDNPTPEQAASWKRTIAKDCGNWIADGWQIMTVYSREEYQTALASMRMFDPEKDRAQPSML